MGGDHRRAHVLVPEQLLDRADVVPALQQVRRDAVPQRVAARSLRQTRREHRLAYGPLAARAELLRLDEAYVAARTAAAKAVRSTNLAGSGRSSGKKARKGRSPRRMKRPFTSSRSSLMPSRRRMTSIPRHEPSAARRAAGRRIIRPRILATNRRRRHLRRGLGNGPGTASNSRRRQRRTPTSTIDCPRNPPSALTSSSPTLSLAA